MMNKLTFRKILLYLNIGVLIIAVIYGVKDRILEVDYWVTVIMLIAILPGTIHIQNKQ